MVDGVVHKLQAGEGGLWIILDSGASEIVGPDAVLPRATTD